MTEFDPVAKPKHYNVHPSGVEAIEICERLDFNVGNAVKYLFRLGLKNDELEDARKAHWYVERARRYGVAAFVLLDVGSAFHAVASVDEGPLGKVLALLIRYAESGHPHGGIFHLTDRGTIRTWASVLEEISVIVLAEIRRLEANAGG